MVATRSAAQRPSGRVPGLGSIFLVLFLDILGFSLVLPFLAEHARDTFHASAFTATLLASVYSLMQFLFVPVWGRLSDRVGRRPVLLFSVLVTGLAMSSLGLALLFGTSVGWLFVPRIVGGIATANLGTASAYIADVTSEEDRARGMGTIGIAFGLGFLVGPALGGALSPIMIHGRTGAVPCFVAGVLSLVNFAWTFFGVPESLAPDKRDVTRRSLWPLNVQAARETFRDRAIARAVSVNFVLIMSFTILDQTFRFFTKDLFGMGPLDTGFVLMFIGIVAAVVQGGMRPITKRFAEATLIQTGTLCQIGAFVGLAVSPSFGTVALYGAAALLALGNGLTQPCIPAYISKRAAPGTQGETLGTNQAFSSLARVCGPAIGGWVYGAAGPRVPYVFSALGMGAAFLLALGLSRTQSKTSTHTS